LTELIDICTAITVNSHFFHQTNQFQFKSSLGWFSKIEFE